MPGYLAYLASVVGAERPPATAAAAARQRAATATLTREERQTRRASRARVVGASLLFVGGFTVVFVLLSAMVLGTVQYLAPQQELLQRLGGVVTIVMGLVFIGLVPTLQRDTRMQPRSISTWLSTLRYRRGCSSGLTTMNRFGQNSPFAESSLRAMIVEPS